MQQSPCSEANTTQPVKKSSSLTEPSAHYRVHKILSAAPILIQMNPVNFYSSYIPKRYDIFVRKLASRLMRVLRLSRRRFKSRSSGLWRRVVLW